MRRRRELLGAGLLLLSAGLACGSRTGLGGFSGQQGVGPATGGIAGSGASPGVGGSFGTGGVVGDGGAPGAGGAPGSGGNPGFEVALDCPTEVLGGVEPGQTVRLDVISYATTPLQANRWTVQHEDCDGILPTPSFIAVGTEDPVLELTPGRPGLYHVVLDVVTASGQTDSCELMVRFAGRGVRVDLCWDTSTTVDLDLYLHTPLNQNPYYSGGGPLFPGELGDRVTEDTCNPANCGPFAFSNRPAFDLQDSPVDFCAAGPSGQDFVLAGFCPNPRSGKDNNQQQATGTSEVVQVDNPRAGDTMRVMVQNFSNLPAQPHLFIYCNDERWSVDLPDAAQNFVTDQEPLPGVLWRAADITPFDFGGGTGCSVTPPTHPTNPGVPYVTVNDVDY